MHLPPGYFPTTVNIAPTGLVQLQVVPGQVAAGVAEIQSVAAGPFNPNYRQGNALNWVPDVRTPMFVPAFTFSLSNDGITFGPEQNLFPGASAADKFIQSPHL
jgi:hypothetical protein